MEFVFVIGALFITHWAFREGKPKRRKKSPVFMEW
jgi:hypothetical protein